MRDLEIGQPINSGQRQKLQTALHAKAKAEPGYRFYALYDKIGRADILAHAYAQCRSNKGAPGVDRQDFEAVEAYGVERWLSRTGACAQAGDLPTGTDQARLHTEGQRQAQAAGHLNLAGSGLHDGSDPPGLTRGRPSLGTLCLPPRAQRPAGGGRGGGAGVSRPSGRGGRRPRGRLREHPARQPSQVGSAPDRRSARAASDQDVAGAPRGRNPTTGAGRHARPRRATSGAAFRRALRSHPCWRISRCAGSCWDGRCSGSSEAWAHGSSLMPTIS